MNISAVHKKRASSARAAGPTFCPIHLIGRRDGATEDVA